MKRVVLACALVGCNSNAIVVAPVIDVPANDSASGFPVDVISLSAAHAGNPLDLTSASFTKGQTIDLAGIPFGDDLVLHITGRVGSSDVSYGRTCAFNLNQNAAVPEPHLYFSRNAKFGQLGFKPLLRTSGAAVTYHDGSGILIGGVTPDPTGTPVTDVERFDVSTGEYRPLTTISPRIGSVITLIGTGSETLVAVIGGTDTNGVGATFVETIEAENPADRRVEHVDDMTMGRTGLTATTLTSGDVVVMGGSGGTCGSGSDASTCVEEITLVSGTPQVRPAHGTLLRGRWSHTATRLGDEVGAPVLVAGGVGIGSGSSAPAPIAEAELYKPLISQFSPTFNAKMVIPRSQHQAVRLPDGSVVIIGGVDVNNQPVRQLEVFTLDSGFVAPLGSVLPASAGVIGFTATSLPDGRVLVTGGLLGPGGGEPSSTALLLEINTDTGAIDVLPTDHLTVGRAGHGATVLCDGSVLIAGGTSQPQPAEIYNPAASLGRR